VKAPDVLSDRGGREGDLAHGRRLACSFTLDVPGGEKGYNTQLIMGGIEGEALPFDVRRKRQKKQACPRRGKPIRRGSLMGLRPVAEFLTMTLHSKGDRKDNHATEAQTEGRTVNFKETVSSEGGDSFLPKP